MSGYKLGMTNKNDGINRPPRQDNKNKSEDKMNYITKEKRDEVLEKTFTFTNGIVHAYEEYRNVNYILHQSQNVDPHVRNMAREQMFLLDRAHCFELSKDIFQFALKSEMTCDLDMPISEECKPCADTMFVYYTNTLAWMTLRDYENDCYHIFYGCLDEYARKHPSEINACPLHKVAILKVGEPLQLVNPLPYQSEHSNGQRDLSFDFILMLRTINTARITKKEPAGSRQQRKALQRGMGKAVDTWHRVTWNIDKPSKAKETYDKSYHKMPLHWNRGHWKRAKEHHPKSQQRPHALNTEHRDMWWTWIDGYWAGHPAFGFKKQYHAPKLKVN